MRSKLPEKGLKASFGLIQFVFFWVGARLSGLNLTCKVCAAAGQPYPNFNVQSATNFTTPRAMGCMRWPSTHSHLATNRSGLADIDAQFLLLHWVTRGIRIRGRSGQLWGWKFRLAIYSLSCLPKPIQDQDPCAREWHWSSSCGSEACH